MYLPPSTGPWTLVYLDVPATWPGGARRLTARVRWDMTRTFDGVPFVWLQVTTTRDKHIKPFRGAFYSQRLVSHR
jgi:hypothetical protein